MELARLEVGDGRTGVAIVDQFPAETGGSGPQRGRAGKCRELDLSNAERLRVEIEGGQRRLGIGAGSQFARDLDPLEPKRFRHDAPRLADDDARWGGSRPANAERPDHFQPAGQVNPARREDQFPLLIGSGEFGKWPAFGREARSRRPPLGGAAPGCGDRDPGLACLGGRAERIGG